MEPTKKRIEVLDYLRGFALLGIIFANIVSIIHVTEHTGNVDIVYMKYLNILDEAKFFSIFSLLFGIGFYIFFHNAKQKDVNPYFLYLRRILILLLLGLIHQIFQPGEALFFYAIVGLPLLLFTFVNKRINLVLGLILLALGVLSGNKITFIPGLFILGYTIGQYDLHKTIYHHAKALRISLLLSTIGFIISMVILQLYYVAPAYDLVESTMSNETFVKKYETFSNLIVYTAPFISLFYVLVFVYLLKFEGAKKILRPLKYYGQMALTNYLLNTFLIIIVGKFVTLTFAQTGLVCVAILAVQMAFSMIWLRAFRYGPIEYIWRMGTYLQVFKIKRS
ncbi:DUF418 domain-containing protein [Staphylococcus schleiferi]|uniref:DUF418 domain-containing protein n=1 Tax=Staphylococcus schleiferi TaxID=1295 RepID=UPI00143224B5|nr:DUF418 domain-containing protein [Staphylococcus schleiferi]NHA42166.1 hypothetical protein [Staphylococcus schleiferi]